jgi:hypothetical protein
VRRKFATLDELGESQGELMVAGHLVPGIALGAPRLSTEPAFNVRVQLASRATSEARLAALLSATRWTEHSSVERR